MSRIGRRRFLQVGASASGVGLGASALPLRISAAAGAAPDSDDRVVRLSGDGLGLTPVQYSRLLGRLCDERGIAPDSYSIGGVVEELEQEFARVLGKERAVFMPTGTLANHMAVRALANGPSRVIVQEDSHFYLDEGDCAQTLSSLTLMPLAPGRASFTAADVQQLLDQTKTGRVLSRASVIAIETPVRRKQGEQFDGAELANIVSLARREGIRLHLDGARLFLQAAYTGEPVAETAKPFDTVYISLYKYFNAASGAVLAGPRDLLDPMFHGRRMFGGGMPNVWPFAAVALHYLAGFSDRFSQAVKRSEDVITTLSQNDRFGITRVPRGTNLFRLKVSGDAAGFQKRLAARGILLSPPSGDGFLIGVNETWNRMPAPEIADAFAHALSPSSSPA
jgi:threonine aldolase